MGTVSPASVQETIGISTTPDGHFTAAPNGGVPLSFKGRVGGARSYPTVGNGIVLPTGTRTWSWGYSWSGGWARSWRPGLCPVYLASLQITEAIISAPDDHFTITPDCRVEFSWSGRVVGARGYPIIRAGIISAPGVEKATIIFSTPDDHFAISPNCGVKPSASGRVGGAGRRPTIGSGIVSTAAVQVGRKIIPAPNDHFAASPHRRVLPSCLGRVDGAGSGPAIRAGIVPPASVQLAPVISTPNDHVTASPDCGVRVSISRCINDTCR